MKQTDKWEDLIEKLADIEHQRWSDWQKWCHKILRENCPSQKLEKVLERWDKQINTDYKDLSEKEKESDREQVMRYFLLIKQTLKSQEENFKKVLRDIVGKREENCYICEEHGFYKESPQTKTCGDKDCIMELARNQKRNEIISIIKDNNLTIDETN